MALQRRLQVLGHHGQKVRARFGIHGCVTGPSLNRQNGAVKLAQNRAGWEVTRIPGVLENRYQNE
jgi:hypothetical protein